MTAPALSRNGPGSVTLIGLSCPESQPIPISHRISPHTGRKVWFSANTKAYPAQVGKYAFTSSSSDHFTRVPPPTPVWNTRLVNPDGTKSACKKG
jgi:hypothetical protein